MSDLTHRILTDRDAFPDDRKIVLGDGQEVTVKEFRDAMMPKSEMTRMSTDWSQKEQRLTEGYRGLQQQLAQSQQQLEQALAQRQQQDPRAGRNASGEIDEEEILRDPVLGPLARRAIAAEKRADEAHETLKAHEQTLKNYANTWRLANFQGQLDRIKQNPDHKDTNWDDFLTYSQRKPVIDMQSNNIDLEATFQNYSYKRQLESAEKRGEERGVEKGKAAASVPRVPMGRRRMGSRPEGLPNSLQELNMDTVENDPDIQAALQSGDNA